MARRQLIVMIVAEARVLLHLKHPPKHPVVNELSQDHREKGHRCSKGPWSGEIENDI